MGAVIAVAAYLLMHRSDRQFGTLKYRLRVRMLTGWVHVTKLQKRSVVDRHLIVDASFALA